jgi:hypothetical protein
MMAGVNRVELFPLGVRQLAEVRMVVAGALVLAKAIDGGDVLRQRSSFITRGDKHELRWPFDASTNAARFEHRILDEKPSHHPLEDRRFEVAQPIDRRVDRTGQVLTCLRQIPLTGFLITRGHQRPDLGDGSIKRRKINPAARGGRRYLLHGLTLMGLKSNARQ